MRGRFNISNNREEFKEKYEKTQTREIEDEIKEIEEGYIEKAQFDNKTRNGVEEFLKQETDQQLFELAKQWIKDKEEVDSEERKKYGLNTNLDNKGKEYVMKAFHSMGGLDRIKGTKYDPRTNQEINYFYTLRQELDSDNMPLDSQLLVLNLLNKKSSRIGKKKEEEKDETKKAQMQEEFDKFFNLRKQVAEKITGEDLITEEELEEKKIRDEKLKQLRGKLKNLEGKFLTGLRPEIQRNIESKRKEIEAREKELIKDVEDGKISEICGLQKATERIKTLYEGIKNRRIDKFIEKEIKGKKECTAKELKDIGIESFAKREVNISEMLSTAFDRENELKTALFEKEDPNVLKNFLGEYGIEVERKKLDKAIKDLKEIDKISIWDLFLFLFENLLSKKSEEGENNKKIELCQLNFYFTIKV